MDIIGQVPSECAKRYGDKVALIFKNRRLSFREIDAFSNKLGNSLKKLGLQKGDRISIYSQNCWEWIISYYAIAKIGAVVNPINVMLTPEEVLYVVNDCGAKALMTSPDKAEAVLGILDEANTLKNVMRRYRLLDN